ncbi:MAG: hypothetical protein WC047_00065 [Kiritimatiellales bacterium]
MSTILININTRVRGDHKPNLSYERFDEFTYGGIQYVAIAPMPAGISPMNRDYCRTRDEMQVEDDWKSGIEEDVADLVLEDADIRTDFATADGVVSAALNTKITEKTGYGVKSGLVVAAQDTPDMTVKVSSGISYSVTGERHPHDAVASITITPDPTAARVDIVYDSPAGVITYLECAPATTPVAGEKDFTIATNAVATDTLTIGGVEFTAVASEPTAVQFVPGVDAAATAAVLAPILAANATIAALYDVAVVGAVITLAEKAAGMGSTPADASFTGTLVVTNGAATTSAAATYPAAATLPSGGFLLAHVAVAADATTIGSANITDKRVMLDAIRTAATAPTATPTKVGETVVVDDGTVYFSVGTSSAADWKQITFVAE